METGPFEDISTLAVRELQIVIRDSPMIPIEIEPFVGMQFESPEQVYKIFRNLASVPVETFLILHLTVKNQIAAMTTVSIGTLDTSIIHAREVYRTAIVNLTSRIICIHQHPSGMPEPSKEDIEITSRLKKAGEIIGIRLMDHIIIGQNGYFSFMEARLL